MKISKSFITLLLGLVLVLYMNGGLMAQGGGFKESTPQESSPQGDSKGSGKDVTSVKNALAMPDDTKVVLQGKIVRSLGEDKYLFQDPTGEITLEIDDDVWKGQNVTPDDWIEILGEIDKEVTSDMEVDVNSLMVIWMPKLKWD
jgi:uncharacterized protein (TIGR00156 family)